MIVTQQIRVRRREIDQLDLLETIVAERARGQVLRWAVVRCTDDAFDVECVSADAETRLHNPLRRRRAPHGRACVVSLVPTGIACSIGGFAGDAGPATQLLASCCDLLVTNPNAVNASNYASLPTHVLYTEGSMIDLFCGEAIELAVPRANRVGIVLDQCPDEDLAHVLTVADAVRAVHGVDIVGYARTDSPIGARAVRMRSGSYVGVLDDDRALLAACQRLVDAGATAIAVASTVCDLPEGDYERHFAGRAPNPVGGAEAVLSHLICRRFGLPAAHAPLRNFMTAREPLVERVDPRAAGEAVSFSGLASVLMGLHRAPQIAARVRAPRDVVSFADVLAVVAPATALGGAPVFHAARRGIPVIAVRENTTLLDVTARSLSLEGVIDAASYAEAAGQLIALREGIALDTVVRPLAPLASVDAGVRHPAGAAPRVAEATRRIAVASTGAHETKPPALTRGARLRASR